MIDLSGLDLPPDAPEPGTCVRVERPEPGLVVLWLEPPHRKFAVLDLPLLRDLDLALAPLELEEGLRGLVVTGREPLSFLAGADLDMLASATDPALVERVVRVGQLLFGRLASMTKRGVRTVAAVGGPVPGGAFELALACSRIVLADDPKSRIGLPETKLGILPAWGGSTRLPRRVGVPIALDAILNGKLYPAKPAYKKGLVDRLTPPEYLVRVASEIALGRTSCRRRKRGLKGLIVDRNPAAMALVTWMTRRQVLAKTRGHYPAPLSTMNIVAWSPLRPARSSFQAEQEQGARLAVSPVCKNLIGVFRLSEMPKRLGRYPDGRRAEPFSRATVLGAGVMGGGIASLFAERGVATRLYDVSPAGLDAALIEHRRALGKQLKRRRMTQSAHDAALDRLDATRALVGIEGSELALEAVAERLEVKRAVLGEVAAKVSADCVLCTNTSSLSVDAIAEGLPHPERVVGLHFFNPVRMMPLVEVVRGARTSPEAVTRAAALALALGKTPVVVKNVPGFLVNRLLGPYLDEALALYANGVAPKRIDDLALAFGMPMGPLRLLDEVGLDIATHAAESLRAGYGERMQPSFELTPLTKEGRLGKKSGRGFYDHPKGRKGGKTTLTDDLVGLLPPRTQLDAGLADELVTDRLMLAMLAEGIRALDDEVVASAEELDLATVFGMGFPPFRGGLLRWADALGPEEVLRRLDALASSPGVVDRPGGPARFAAPESLRGMARAGARYR